MVDKWIDQLKDLKCLSEDDLEQLCEKTKEIFLEESNVQYVNAPVIICGDIRGQIYTLLEILKKCGEISNKRFIFMGNYINGDNGVEVFELLLSLKIKYPEQITLLRGNQECRYNGNYYGFLDETLRKYGNGNAYQYFIDLFDYLPLAALVEGKIFCVHGGLSPFISVVDQIRFINRKMEIPSGFCSDGMDSCKSPDAFSDLLYGYPDDIETWDPNLRWPGYGFGWKVANKFNHINGLELICCGASIVQEGFKYYFKEKNVCLVFSTPNLRNRGNKASILKMDKELSRTIVFLDYSEKKSSNEHPKTMFPSFL